MSTPKPTDPAEPAPGFYTRRSLNVETYDTFTAQFWGNNDVALFERYARSTGGPVLELACGTGRVTWALAQAGHEITGLDRSTAMLEIAGGKGAQHDPATTARIQFIQGDMSAFSLDPRFGLVFIPYRSFLGLTTPEAQRACLTCAHRHLRSGGLLVIDIFDPRLDLCVPGAAPTGPPEEMVDPTTGNTVRVDVLGRTNDPVAQTLRERWRFVERSPEGAVLREADETLTLRWVYRFEMRYLLELCGFEIEAELSDFEGSPPAYGREQIWVARRP